MVGYSRGVEAEGGDLSKSTTVCLHEDPELLVAFRDGHRGTLERVYRRYAGAVERYLLVVARGRAGNTATQPALIADLVQDVFIRAFSADARRAYDGRHEYGHYLATVARNCFIDLLRARSREVLTLPQELPVDISTAPETDDWSDQRSLDVLESFVRRLAPPLRDIYRHRFLRELSQMDTAAALGVTRRAVRTGERRLLSGLRRALVRAGIPLSARQTEARSFQNR